MRIPPSYIRKVRLVSLEGQNIDNIEHNRAFSWVQNVLMHIFVKTLDLDGSDNF